MSPTVPCTKAILLCDEQERFLTSLCVQLHDGGFKRVFAISDSDRIAAFMDEAPVEAVVVALYPPFAAGVEQVRRMRRQHPDTSVIVILSVSDQTVAVECMRLGAVDVMTRPVDSEQLKQRLSTVMGCVPVQRRQSLQRPGSLHSSDDPFAAIVTGDRRMQTIFRYVEAIAPTAQAVMITGETGTGKELVARALHQVSGRSGDFVSVNVAGLDDIMFSDTLFGHGKGAFTGADRERKGLIEKAAGGTLFLDEIGDLNIASQVKLLRLLQENEYYRLGSDTIMSSTARIIVATNCALEEKIASGVFRTDLYYRLCSHHIHLPALRERKGDIPLLVEHFARVAAVELSRAIPLASADTLDALLRYEFPGNVRELKGLVSNAVAVANGGVLNISGTSGKKSTPVQLPQNSDYSALTRTFGRLPTLLEAEEYLICEALRSTGGNQRAAALLLGISRQALNKRLLRDPRYLDQVAKG